MKLIEAAPQSANEAALLLGIAVLAPEDPNRAPDHPGLLLALWSVQMSLGRRSLKPIPVSERTSIERVTEDTADLIWRGNENDH